MNDLQKLGGLGALLQGALFMLSLVLALVILPRQGFTTPDAFNDPATVLPFAANSLLPSLVSVINMGMASGTVLAVLALHERVPEGWIGPGRIATMAGLIAAVLFLVGGTIDLVALPQLTRLYPHHQAMVGAAYLAERMVVDGLLVGAIFAYRWWVLLASWTALRGGTLPKPLTYLGLVLGATVALAFAVQPLALLGTVLASLWTLGLGLVLLREQGQHRRLDGREQRPEEMAAGHARSD